ncbi:hypothetical protein [Luteimonas arsenica]|uniref:hypothetical protein n=1 Tax=Luteimonas arsenica TaxID=1586242 RepID=UPI001056DBB5|nr:hypothetical protein [Luteimonas arsenica]
MNVAVRPVQEQGMAQAASVLVRFGPDNRLTGILAGSGASGPTLLLPSAGLQPRSGPFRLHVELAQRLAARGIGSFRYDVPGVGEAPRLPGWDPARTTIAAIDRLEQDHGCRIFAAGGICSAADAGWEAATLDSRVSALLMLDGICFGGPWYRYARVLGLLRRLPGEWRRFARMLPGRIGKQAGFEAEDFRNWPDHAQARHQFARFLERDVPMLFVFSGAYEDHFLHPRQFEWSFGRAVHDPRVDMHFWPDCDHTYFGGLHRERLIATIEQWMLALAGRGAP